MYVTMYYVAKAKGWSNLNVKLITNLHGYNIVSPADQTSFVTC